MTIAGQKGKFSVTGSASDLQEIQWQRLEDVLTSDVFGAYRYLPPSLGICALLAKAWGFRTYLQKHGLALEQVDTVRIKFWPQLDDGSEPDLLINLGFGRGETEVSLLVEAKLYATQHEIDKSGEVLSQLGHYSQKHFRGEYAAAEVRAGLADRLRPTLFITAHSTPPRGDLDRARRELFSFVQDEDIRENLGIFWVSWGHAGKVARELWHEQRPNVSEMPWLRHLLDLANEIEARDLMPRPAFRGFTSQTTPDWVYSRYLWQHCRLPTGLCTSRRFFDARNKLAAWTPTLATRTDLFGWIPATVQLGNERFFEESEHDE